MIERSNIAFRRISARTFACLFGVILLLIFSNETLAQHADYVGLELTWTTLPKKVKISIIHHSDGNINLRLEKTLHSERFVPTSTEAQWDISQVQFDLIKNAVYKIKLADLLSGGSSPTLDGYESKISFANYNARIVYSSSNPSSHAKERKLVDYNAAINLILETAGIKPDGLIK